MAPALMESKMQSSGKAMSELEKLRHAVFHAHVDELGRLLADSARDVDLDTKSCLEESLLMLAVRSGIATRREVGLGAMQRGSASMLAVVRCLLEARASVNTCDIAQETPLMEAACAGDVGMCQLLLEFSADPTCRSAAGQRAADFASDGARSSASSGSAEVTRLLEGAAGTGEAQVLRSQTLQEEAALAAKTHADVLATTNSNADGGKTSSPRTSTSFFDFDELGEVEPVEPEPRLAWKKASIEEMEKLDNSEEEAQSTSSSSEDSSEETSEESAEVESVPVPVPVKKFTANLGSGSDEPELVGFQYTFDKGQVQQPAERTGLDISALPVDVQKLRRQCAKMGLSVEWCIDREVMQDLLQKVDDLKFWGVASLISECTSLGLPNPNYIGREEIMHQICTVLVWQKLPLNLLESETRRRQCFYYSNQTTKESKRKECLRRLIADSFPDRAAQPMGGFGYAPGPLRSSISAIPVPGARTHKPAWTGTPVTREPTHWEVWRASMENKSSSSDSSDSDEEKQNLKKLHPRVKKALQRSPGFSGRMPGNEAESWTDQELNIYFESNGAILPRRGTKESKHPAPKKDEKAKTKEDRRGANARLSGIPQVQGANARLSGIPQVQTAADIASAAKQSADATKQSVAAMKQSANAAQEAQRVAEVQAQRQAEVQAQRQAEIEAQREALRDAHAKHAGSLNKAPGSPPQRAAPQSSRPKMVGRPKFGAAGGRPQPKMYPGNLFSHRVKASVPGQPRPAAEPLPKYSPPKAPSRLHLADEHFETLGLPGHASIEDVRKAYKRLAFQYHPDKNTVNNDGSMFKKISAAYEAISQHMKG